MTRTHQTFGILTDPDKDRLASDPVFQTLLSTWRESGRKLVTDQHAELAALIDMIEPEIRRGRHAQAAALAQVAANHAVIWHPGTFSNAALDSAIQRLGAAAVPMAAGHGRRGAGPLHVLHVMTQASAIGGHARMVRNWIREDRENHHSLAMTRQTTPLPASLTEAVCMTGGRVHYVNRRFGGLLIWARELQGAFASADLVILHVHNQDILPFLAMAGMKARPPVLLLNHADHVFWLGANLVDGVVSSRMTGHRLCALRRGIPAARNLTLPLCLESTPPLERGPSAKRAIGLPPDSTVILSIARSVKFRTLCGLSFADGLVPVLKTDPRLHLVVVGPKGAVDWSSAEAKTPERIHLIPETVETRPYLAAADVYVDSFPFSSITSMLEAGLSGLPVVTRYPFGPGNEILGGDSIGLDAMLAVARNSDEFRQIMLDLITDPHLRATWGQRMKAEIERTNMGAGWRSDLARIYGTAFCLPPRVPGDSIRPPERQLSDLDLFIPYVFGPAQTHQTPATRLAQARELALKTLPSLQRLSAWSGLAMRRRFTFSKGISVWRGLIPEPLTVRLRIPMRRSK